MGHLTAGDIEGLCGNLVLLVCMLEDALVLLAIPFYLIKRTLSLTCRETCSLFSKRNVPIFCTFAEALRLAFNSVSYLEFYCVQFIMNNYT